MNKNMLFSFESPGNVTESPGLDSLELLMNDAFNQKEKQSYDEALAAFVRALQLFPGSDAAPYIIIEIANILKAKGLYDDAINVFSEGRKLPGLLKNPSLHQEFIDTIAYLRIIKNILVENRLGFVPFSQIPQPVINMIDSEFADWKRIEEAI